MLALLAITCWCTLVSAHRARLNGETLLDIGLAIEEQLLYMTDDYMEELDGLLQ